MAASRAKYLQRGINLSEWFAQVHSPKGYTKEQFDTWTTAEDIALVGKLGFDHVRLSVNPEPFWRNQHADDLSPELMDSLDAAVKMILDQNLAVTLDIHPDSTFKQRLEKDDAFVEQFSDFWRAFAKHYSTYPAERVTFEILNEPEVKDRYRWAGIQARLARAIREGAPQHTILATGALYSSEDELLFLEPLRDPNVIYVFHYYSPHLFTHQGATWGVNYWHRLQGLPYPSTPENVQAIAENLPDADHRLEVLRYGADRWNAARIALEIGQVDAWAKRWNVPVVCNEFGVYRKANAQQREQWIKDVRSTLERYGFGWAMWDYSGGFGVVSKVNGVTTVDDGTVRALGLK